MVAQIDSVAFKLLELYRRANKTCQETCSFVRSFNVCVTKIIQCLPSYQIMLLN